MIKPKSLNHDDCIGIISPSYWLSEDDLQRTTSYLKTIGYKLKFGISNSLRWGPFAGHPQERADDIHRMFSDPDIKAIICARGGYGANRVLPLIDYELIRENPKIFIGYSDITAYLTSITQKTG
ncbi:MAG: LD-carboxypeptidase, partial [Chloroflexi bacterium]|nr:LD-carboxypeptidase [Chloroflexota bacterium]